MKKITFLVFLINFIGFSQQKSTGMLTLNTSISVNLVLDNPSATVFLTLIGPNDRWFALQFGDFYNGMDTGTDLVYWNGTTLVDAHHAGVALTPIIDTSNDWNLISNENKTPSNGLRKLVYSRSFNTGDVNDYTFIFSDAKIDFAFAQMGFASFSLAYHGGAPYRGVFLNRDLTVLGVEDFSLKAIQIYPNPSKGIFMINTKTALTKISIYSHTGSLIQTSIINAGDSFNGEFKVGNLQTGIYLINFENETETVWKRVIIN
jgi:hypothetical protein